MSRVGAEELICRGGACSALVSAGNIYQARQSSHQGGACAAPTLTLALNAYQGRSYGYWVR